MFDISGCYLDGPMNFPVDPKPNLITGVGHGHCRPLRRKKEESNHVKKLKKARKMIKQSRRKNRHV